MECGRMRRIKNELKIFNLSNRTKVFLICVPEMRKTVRRTGLKVKLEAEFETFQLDISTRQLSREILLTVVIQVWSSGKRFLI
jgi:hypothetical protein